MSWRRFPAATFIGTVHLTSCVFACFVDTVRHCVILVFEYLFVLKIDAVLLIMNVQRGYSFVRVGF